ncbi:DUF2019 domain-containing protein [Myxococcus sp. RHSTA-1-4]|uniref:DUF2019 domain-containing protein n=1 Tax=Myxococcus sp. RHSTA-1-4 TaxID=2874601 RepID=UPI001CBE8EDB|nr:DUF2019 domain-containing protein [Myxococcus sp. RHSTA-1-4]MBZ4419876.1 DUF2019 domain-containing protein [Myxococcus sp. RHSTA-1-4]
MKRESMKGASIPDLMARYEEAAGLHGQASQDGNHRLANAQYKRVTATWMELRSRGEEGRSALVRLMGSANPHVRGWAASHVLEFDPRAAEAELERLASGPPGVARLDAAMVLREWRAGTLSFPTD